jgi:hypothetical protein
MMVKTVGVDVEIHHIEAMSRRQPAEFDYSVRELPSIGTQKKVRQLIEADRQ